MRERIKKLLCLPYAGGSSAMYNSLKKELSDRYEVIAFDYPGHGNRSRENLLDNLMDTVDDVYDTICAIIADDFEYAILGYSMGSIVAYEVTKRLVLKGGPIPEKVFYVACNSPDTCLEDDVPYDKEDAEFIKYLSEMGGINEVDFMDSDVSAYFLPILRSDFKQLYEYDWKQKICALPIPQVIITSQSENNYHGWSKASSLESTYFTISRGHFFIRDYYKELSDIIKNI